MERATGLEPATLSLEMRKNVKHETGIEPATPGLGSRCSTIELLVHIVLTKVEVNNLLPTLLDETAHFQLG